MTQKKNKNVQQLMKRLITHSQSANALNEKVTALIIEDIITLYKQNCEALGPGVLVFVPTEPARSNFTTLRELKNDRAVAEENCEKDLAMFLSKTEEIIEKIADTDKAAILLTDGYDLKLFVINIDQAVENINSLFNSAIVEF